MAAATFVVLVLVFLVGGALMVYRDLDRRSDDAAHDPQPMLAAFWSMACWPVGVYFWMRGRRRSADHA